MNLGPAAEQAILKLQSRKVYLEGNILKVLVSDNEEFISYLRKCKARDIDSRKKRLAITKQVQEQNKELLDAAAENSQLTQELEEALKAAEKLRDRAVEDLETLQKKTQFELVGKIVRVALATILSIGFMVSGLFIISMFTDNNNAIVESTWSNLMGILLTNSFSIVGTIMGVKYATEK
jgi:flagellar biosynthesis regulator FlaF